MIILEKLSIIQMKYYILEVETIQKKNLEDIFFILYSKLNIVNFFFWDSKEVH